MLPFRTHAVGVDAALFDATAVLIAVVTLGQLPVGPSRFAAAAAAGLLLTVTGTPGGLCFVRLGRRRSSGRPAPRAGEEGSAPPLVAASGRCAVTARPARLYAG